MMFFCAIYVWIQDHRGKIPRYVGKQGKNENENSDFSFEFGHKLKIKQPTGINFKL